MNHKIKIAIMSGPMDRRPERAFFAKRLVENLLEDPELEVSLVHYKKMADEPLYKKAREILIPILPLPWGSNFFSFIWFCFTTKEKFDVVHWLSFRIYPFFWLFPAKKVVVTAHDGYVGIWTLPNTIFWLVLSFFNKYLDAVIGVSEYAKKEIMKTYHLPEEKAFVAYNGISSVYRHIPEVLAREVLKKYNVFADKYFFHISGLQPHKNVKRMVEAYILLRDNFSAVEEKLLTIGKTSYREDVQEIIKKTKYSKDIIPVGSVPLSDLPAFYSQATSLVLVSLNEGCGLPILESMACGTPVLTSNFSAMPETAGGAALLVDPYSPEEIMKGMRQMIIDESLRKNLIEKGYRRARLFTWKRYTKETLEVYKKVLNLQKF